MIQIKFEIDLGHSCFLTASACIAALPRYLLKIHWSLYQFLKKLGVKRVTYRARPQYDQILQKISSVNLGQVRTSENSRNALHTQKSSYIDLVFQTPKNPDGQSESQNQLNCSRLPKTPNFKYIYNPQHKKIRYSKQQSTQSLR